MLRIFPASSVRRGGGWLFAFLLQLSLFLDELVMSLEKSRKNWIIIRYFLLALKNIHWIVTYLFSRLFSLMWVSVTSGNVGMLEIYWIYMTTRKKLLWKMFWRQKTKHGQIRSKIDFKQFLTHLISRCLHYAIYNFVCGKTRAVLEKPLINQKSVVTANYLSF